ncbi:hypothetical protein SC1_03277 [Sphingopyxis sp. C-1]|nr:hypothetical protein SC1_03277 [Sphingopyxis sp. C-1]
MRRGGKSQHGNSKESGYKFRHDLKTSRGYSHLHERNNARRDGSLSPLNRHIGNNCGQIMVMGRPKIE